LRTTGTSTKRSWCTASRHTPSASVDARGVRAVLSAGGGLWRPRSTYKRMARS
jgi:hypothetical protein